jgi:hypothetical protein
MIAVVVDVPGMIVSFVHSLDHDSSLLVKPSFELGIEKVAFKVELVQVLQSLANLAFRNRIYDFTLLVPVDKTPVLLILVPPETEPSHGPVLVLFKT